MAWAGRDLTANITGNLHVTPRSIENRIINKAIYVDTTKRLDPSVETIGLINATYKLLTIRTDTLILGGWFIVDVPEGIDDDIVSFSDADDFTYMSGQYLNAGTVVAFDGGPKYHPTANEFQLYCCQTTTLAKFWVIVQLVHLFKP
jgi:hypothetical protein